MINKKPVFFDATGRRAARLSVLGWIAALVASVLAIGFVTSLMMAKPVPNVDLPGRAYATNPPELVKKAVAPGLLRQAVRLATEARNRRLEKLSASAALRQSDAVAGAAGYDLWRRKRAARSRSAFMSIGARMAKPALTR